MHIKSMTENEAQLRNERLWVIGVSKNETRFTVGTLEKTYIWNAPVKYRNELKELFFYGDSLRVNATETRASGFNKLINVSPVRLHPSAGAFSLSGK